MRLIGARTPRGSWARPARSPWLTDCEYLNAILNCTSRIVSPTVGARLMQVSDMKHFLGDWLLSSEDLFLLSTIVLSMCLLISMWLPDSLRQSAH